MNKLLLINLLMCMTLAGCGGDEGDSKSGSNGGDGKTDVQLDTDKDGVIDELDSDDDNDGTPDEEDAFPLNKDEQLDTDNDGIGNNADPDDDGDGVKDDEDAYPLDPTRHSDTPINQDIDLTVSNATASEENGNIAFNIELSEAPESNITFSYTLTNETANISEDIQNTGNTIVFAQGQTQQSLSFPITQDNLYECKESFTLTISGHGNSEQATGTILNSGNLPILSFSKTSEIVSEDIGNIDIEVNLSEASCEDINIDVGYQYLTAQSDDIKQAEAVVISKGNTNASLNISVVNDSLAEGSESFKLALQADGEAQVSSELIEVTIQHSDISPQLTDIESAEDSESANFTITLPLALTETISFPYSTSDVTATSGQDYQGIQGNISFAPGQTQKNINVPLIEDEIYECHETFELNVAESTAIATLTNGDDEGPTLTMLSNKSEVNEDAGTAKVEFELSKASCGHETLSVSYDYVTASSDDITAKPVITIPQGQEKVSLEFPITNDTLKEEREKLTLTFSRALDSNIIGETEHELHILPVTEKLYSGDDYACAQSQDNLIKCWGENTYNRFRLNNPIDVIGDSFGEATKAFHVCHNSLDEKKSETLVVKEAGAGEGCDSYGGFYHYSGVDQNNNGTVLDDPRSSKSFCNTEEITYMFAPSIEIEPGAQCEAGGFTVLVGEDLNGNGQLETDEMGENLQASNFGDDKVENLTMNHRYGCLHYETGKVACWTGQDDLTLSDMKLIDFGQDRKVTHFSASYSHYCAVLEDGDLKCWNANDAGELGLGHDTGLIDPPEESVDLGTDEFGLKYTAKQVMAGSELTCALLHDGNIKCWGTRSSSGSLGYDQRDYTQGDNYAIGDEPGEMGNNLPVIDLGTNKTAVKLFEGEDSICAQLNTDEVVCWGYNQEFQMGMGRADETIGDHGISNYANACNEDEQAMASKIEQVPTDERCEFGGVKMYIDEDDNGNGVLDEGEYSLGSYRCHAQDQPYRFEVTNIEAGGETCNEFGGFNIKGGIDQDNDGTFNAEMGDNLTPLEFTSSARVTDLEIFTHGCAVLEDGTFKCWGDNYSGALGVEENIVWGDDPGETPATIASPNVGTDRTVKQVVLSLDKTCVLLDNSDVKCWGDADDEGVLGNPLFNDLKIGDEANEMGDNLPSIRLY